MGSEAMTLQSEVLKALRFPIAVADILRKRQALKRELLKQTNLVPDADCNSWRFDDNRS